MAHIPHLLLSGPWSSEHNDLSEQQRAHLERVLRVRSGDPVSYTDGRGALGSGHYEEGRVIRGKETLLPRPTDLVVVAAPPDSRDRSRFMVEKLAELGVAELLFLATRFGQGRPPKAAKLERWAVSGLEQSRGAWLMATSMGLVTFDDIEGSLAVCDPEGSREKPCARIVVIGPEGGWGAGEVPEGAARFHLGDTILRVETAAIVAAVRLM